MTPRSRGQGTLVVLILSPATHRLARIRRNIAANAQHGKHSKIRHFLRKNEEFRSIGGWRLPPMMEWTDRHCPLFSTVLFNPACLAIHGKWWYRQPSYGGMRVRLLEHDAAEHPVALQLGRLRPRIELAQAARIGEFGGLRGDQPQTSGVPAIGLQSGAFGACLMRDAPPLVAGLRPQHARWPCGSR